MSSLTSYLGGALTATIWRGFSRITPQRWAIQAEAATPFDSHALSRALTIGPQFLTAAVYVTFEILPAQIVARWVSCSWNWVPASVIQWPLSASCFPRTFHLQPACGQGWRHFLMRFKCENPCLSTTFLEASAPCLSSVHEVSESHLAELVLGGTCNHTLESASAGF